MSLTQYERTIFFMKQQPKQPITSLQDNTPKPRFIIVYDSVYKNTNLTTDEIALLIKLISLAPTFKPTSQKLADILNITIKALNKASKGLQAKGYLKIKKFGKNSEWIITQEPIQAKINDFSKESLLNGLLNYQITFKDLELLHKLKRIDDRLYIDIVKDYTKELIRVAKINVYDED